MRNATYEAAMATTADRVTNRGSYSIGGIIFTAAALKGASASTTLLLLAYALGAATSLAA